MTEQKPQKTGAQYDIGINDPRILLDILGSGSMVWLLKKHLDVLKALAKLFSEKEGSRLSHIDLATAAGVSVSTLSVYIDALTKKSVFSKQKLRMAGKGRKPNLYTLNDIALLEKNEFGEVLAELDPSDQALIPLDHLNNQLNFFDKSELGSPPEDSVVCLPENTGTLKADILSTYSLLSALRLANSGSRTEGSYTSDIHIGPDRLKVKVSAADGYKIAGVIDTKALIALSTKARHYFPLIDNIADIPSEPLIMELSELLSLLRFKTDGGYRQQAWKMVQAWRHTNFEVLGMTRRVRDLFGDTFVHQQEFSFISRIESLVDTRTGVPDRFAIWFDPKFLARVLHRESRFISTVHNEIMAESVASKLLVYYWCRRAVQLNSEPSSPYQVSHLKREMAPYMFNGDFTNMLEGIVQKTHVENGEHHLFGYRFTREKNPEHNAGSSRKPDWLYRFWLAADDPILLARNKHQHNLVYQYTE